MKKQNKRRLCLCAVSSLIAFGALPFACTPAVPLAATESKVLSAELRGAFEDALANDAATNDAALGAGCDILANLASATEGIAFRDATALASEIDEAAAINPAANGASAFIDGSNILQIDGTAGSDSIGLRLDPPQSSIEVLFPYDGTGTVLAFSLSDIVAIDIDAGADNDIIAFIDVNGDVGSVRPFTLATGDGEDIVVGHTGSLTVPDVISLLTVAQGAMSLMNDADAILQKAGAVSGSANPTLIENAATLVNDAQTTFVMPAASYVEDLNNDLIQVTAQRVLDTRDQVIAAATDLVQDAHFDLAEPSLIYVDNAEADLLDGGQILLDNAQTMLSDPGQLLLQRAEVELLGTETDAFVASVTAITDQLIAIIDNCPEEPDEPPEMPFYCPGVQELVDCLENELDAFMRLAELCELEAAALDDAGEALDAQGDQFEALGDQYVTDADAIVATADNFVIAAENLRAAAELFAANLEIELGGIGDTFDQRATNEFINPGAALAAQAASDVDGLGAQITADADQLVADAEAIITAAQDILGGVGALLGGTPCGSVVTTNTILGGAGPDLLLGTTGNDRIDGFGGLDLIIGAAGDDILNGGDDIDVIFGGPDTNEISGGDGIDIIIGGNDTDCIDGDGGIDIIIARDGDDEISGGLEVDLIIAGPGMDDANGDDGIDVMFGGDQRDTLRGGNCIDVIFGGNAADTIVGGPGQTFTLGSFSLELGDVLFGGDGGDTMYGDEDDDTGDGIDVMFGGLDDDTMFGSNGGDLTAGSFTLKIGNVMFGGPGDDAIDSDDGIDVLFGGDNDDTIVSGIGDLISLNSGSFTLEFGDIIFGNDGGDTIDSDDPGAADDAQDLDLVFAGPGDDIVRAYDGGDIVINSFELKIGNLLFGATGNDDISADAGIDLIFGGPDNDTIQAGDGDEIDFGSGNTINFGDLLFGQDGDDVIHGDEATDPADAMDDGIDLIFAGMGNDRVYSGSGGLVDIGAVDFTFGALIFGSQGDDELYADYQNPGTDMEEGIDLIFAGDGNDIVKGGPGSTISVGTGASQVTVDFGGLLFGSMDNDTIDGGDDMDLVFCGRGADTARAYDGIDLVFGSQDDDNLSAEDGGQIIIPIMGVPTPIALGNLIFGGDGNDIIESEGRDLIDLDLLFGNKCDDVIRAGGGLLDLTFGNSGNDTIFGEGTVELQFGNSGDDTMDAGPGLFDITFGNSGNDIITGNDGADLIFGNSDSDDIDGGNGIPLDLLFGNNQPDIVRGGADINLIFGNRDGDNLIGGGSIDLIFGNRGDDDLDGGGGLDILLGGQDDDRVLGGTGLDIVLGNRGDDDVRGGDGLDLVIGGQGDDWGFGDNGFDLLVGGSGRDKLFGNAGVGLIIGGSGDDHLAGNTSLDLILGGSGNDWITCAGGLDLGFGGDGNDRIFGGTGLDLLFGNNGNDDIDGENGPDLVLGNRGEDDIVGHEGNDILLGNRGNDRLRSGGDGSQKDYILGNRNDDILWGCNNDDKLWGGLGSDTKDKNNCTGFTFAGPGPCSEITGFVREDTNNNTIGDVGMVGVTVYLDLNNNGVLNGGEPSTTTVNDDAATHENERGMFRFVNLSAGSYVVRQIVPAGFMQVAPSGALTTTLGDFSLPTIGEFVNRTTACQPMVGAAGELTCDHCPCPPGTVPMLVETTALRCSYDGTPCLVDDDCDCGGTCDEVVIMRECVCVMQNEGCGPGAFNYVGMGGAIPDATATPGVFTTAIFVPDQFVITDVNVLTEAFDHTFAGDLEITLMSPAGTIATLVDRVGRVTSGNGDDSEYIGDYGFDGDVANDLWSAAAVAPAGTPIASGCYYPTTAGSNAPNGELDLFVGESAFGKWILRVVDHKRIDSGAFQIWRLAFNGSVPLASSNDAADDDAGDLPLDSSLERDLTDTIEEDRGASVVTELPMPPNPPLTTMDIPTNRYLSMIPNNPGRPVAYCVLIPPCRLAYLDRPQLAINADGTKSEWVSDLVDNPVFRDWTEPVIRIRGCPVAPGLTYEIGAQDLFNQKSGTVTLATVPLWGDVAGPGQPGQLFGPPDGVVNGIDVEAVVLAQGGGPEMVSILRADLAPVVPDFIIDQEDIAAVNAAVNGEAYPPMQFGLLDISQCELNVVCNREAADSNCDGIVSVSDIAFFVVAIAQGQDEWGNAFADSEPACDFFCVNDINRDGIVSVGDIGPFVQRLVGN